MIELIVGALVVTGLIWCVAQAAGDLVASWRMSKAGEWDRINERQLRRSERRAKAWKAIRAARSRAAGGDGSYRPGAYAYLNDLYHGFWEKELKKSEATRPQKTQEAVRKKVAKLRKKSGRPVDDMLDVAQIRPEQQPEKGEPEAEEPEWLTPVPGEHLIGHEFPVCTRCRTGRIGNYRADGGEWCNVCGWSKPSRACLECEDGRVYPTTVVGDEEQCDSCKRVYPVLPPSEPDLREHAEVLPTEPVDTRPDADAIQFPTPNTKAGTDPVNEGDPMSEVTGLQSAIAYAGTVVAAHTSHGAAGGETYLNSLASYDVSGETIGLCQRAQEATANAAALWTEFHGKLSEQNIVKDAYGQVPDAGNQTFLTNA